MTDHDSTENLDPDDGDWEVEPPALRLHVPIALAVVVAIAYYCGGLHVVAEFLKEFWRG